MGVGTRVVRIRWAGDDDCRNCATDISWRNGSTGKPAGLYLQRRYGNVYHLLAPVKYSANAGRHGT